MRKSKIKRQTRETDICIDLTIDGTGKSSISTGIPFMDHMLDLFTRHSLMDIAIKASGDIEVDDHHLVEDLGITLGGAIDKALLERKGIWRFGEASVPLDEALARCVIDFSGRPYIVFKGTIPRRKIKTFDPMLLKDFLNGFVASSRSTLHIEIPYAENAHHALEVVFKALGRACQQAVTIHPRIKGVRSTKGKL